MLTALFAILLDILETGIFLSDMDNLEGTSILVSLHGLCLLTLVKYIKLS